MFIAGSTFNRKGNTATVSKTLANEKRHDCVDEAMITTPEGRDYKLEWNRAGNCVVTQTNRYGID